MNIRIEDRWQGFIERVVREGHYGSADDVVGEGLRRLAEQEARRQVLRETLNASIAAGGHASEAEIDTALEAASRDLVSRGFGA